MNFLLNASQRKSRIVTNAGSRKRNTHPGRVQRVSSRSPVVPCSRSGSQKRTQRNEHRATPAMLARSGVRGSKPCAGEDGGDSRSQRVHFRLSTDSRGDPGAVRARCRGCSIWLGDRYHDTEHRGLGQRGLHCPCISNCRPLAEPGRTGSRAQSRVRRLLSPSVQSRVRPEFTELLPRAARLDGPSDRKRQARAHPLDSVPNP